MTQCGQCGGVRLTDGEYVSEETVENETLCCCSLISSVHPHGPADPRWITDDGRCLLCADSYHKTVIAEHEQTISQLTKRAEALTQRNKVMSEALDKLARLGNEPYLGNSTGNAIARDALKSVDALTLSKEGNQ